MYYLGYSLSKLVLTVALNYLSPAVNSRLKPFRWIKLLVVHVLLMLLIWSKLALTISLNCRSHDVNDQFKTLPMDKVVSTCITNVTLSKNLS